MQSQKKNKNKLKMIFFVEKYISVHRQQTFFIDEYMKVST